NFSAAIMAAIVMGGLDWLIGNYTDLKKSPAGRGGSGFLVGALVIYITGKLVSGFSAGIIGSLIGAAVLGIVSAAIPGEKTFR
ncbi:phage holin family protein, partial [Peptoniphilus asaccharolyticus]